MEKKINSEYLFTKYVTDKEYIQLTLYINYANKSYDFKQDRQEGIFPRLNNLGTKRIRAYMELSLEILDFIDSELYSDKNNQS